MNNIIILSILLALFGLSIGFRTQSVGVSGRLLCGHSAAKGVVVRLIDKDQGEKGPDPDDYMAQATANETGYFAVKGSTLELSIIDPEIRIYHDCQDQNKKCQREWIIRIPHKYIYNGENIDKYMNLGDINLEVELENEYRECPPNE